jgi:hypothetical protein
MPPSGIALRAAMCCNGSQLKNRQLSKVQKLLKSKVLGSIFEQTQYNQINQ